MTYVRYCVNDDEPVVVTCDDDYGMDELGTIPLRKMLADMVECYGFVDNHGKLTIRLVRDILLVAADDIEKALDTPLT